MGTFLAGYSVWDVVSGNISSRYSVWDVVSGSISSRLFCMGRC